MSTVLSMEKFKAFKLEEVDGKSRGSFVDITLDDLDPGEVVVRVAYSDVNYKDALAATGQGKILRRPACVGGIDFSGNVVSSSDSRFAMGDAVLAAGFDLGVSHDGGYAQYARVPGGWLVKLPPNMTLWEAMAFGTAGFTAGLGVVHMEQSGLRPENGPVIVSGATGGVGSIAVAILAKLGYDVVAVTGKASEAEWLKKLGARDVLFRKDLNLEKIKPLDKATWAGAVDNLGGEVLAWMAATMKINGIIASIGMAASPRISTTVMPFILRGVRLLGINSTDATSNELRGEVWRRLGSEMKPPLLKDMCRTIVFADLPKVFDDFVAGRVSRRVVVDLSE